MKSLVLSIFSLFSLSANAAQIIDIDASQLLTSNNSDWLIIDVRTPEEYQDGHVPHSINVPHDQIELYMDDLLAYKNKNVVLYCRSGRRASKAGKTLSDLGFTQLSHLEGDMLGWKKAGLPLEK